MMDIKFEKPKHEQFVNSGVEWIGFIPKSWTVRRVKYLFEEINERSESGHEDLLSVSQYTGVTPKREKVTEGELVSTAESLQGYKIVRKNDLVSNIMLAWNGSLGFSSYGGIVSPAYSVYRLKDEGDHEFFHFLLRSEKYKSEYKKRSTGVIESRLRLYTENFFDIECILPNKYDRSLIAKFLSQKTTQIDQTIAIKEQQIELLKERKQILIQQAVTQGLDASVPMKESGVDWIGQIPEHWEVKRVKNIFQLVMEPSEKNNDHELLSVYTDIGVKPRAELEERGNKASTTDGYWIVKKGDIVVNKLLAWMGAIGLSEYNGVTSPAYDILRPKVPVNGFFYHNLFRSKFCSAELKRHSRGIMDMRLRLYFDKFGVVEVPFPPKEEQDEIINHLTKEEEKSNSVVSHLQQQIDKLKEYKTTLINSAVTGKIKITPEMLEA